MPVWSVVLIQAILLAAFEKLMPGTLVFASAYGAKSSPVHLSLISIPLFLLTGLFLPKAIRLCLYLIVPFLLLNDPKIGLILISGFGTLFFLTRMKRNNTFLTFTLIAMIVALLALSHKFHPEPVWTLILLGWGLKSLSWIVTVRTYQAELKATDFLDFFFNPVFYFFTNDLNVLTPRAFLDSKRSITPWSTINMSALRLTLLGLGLLTIYGLLQKYYFLNLANVGMLSSWPVGGVVSVTTAIIFHAANVAVQVSLLNSIGYELQLDMNRPWLAESTIDYWRRMHYYVRDYVYDIVMKPVLTAMLRKNFKLYHFQFLVVVLLYFLFTITQVGYQPFRAERSFTVNLMINVIFISMVLSPTLLKRADIKLGPWANRLLTFAVLIAGYSIIFSLRESF